MKSKSRKPNRIRWAFAIIGLFLLIGTIAYAFTYKINHVDPRKSIPALPYNAMTEAAIHLRVDESNSLFSVGLLLLGVLWGLIITKPDQARITLSDWPEVFMFISANLLLLFSVVLPKIRTSG